MTEKTEKNITLEEIGYPVTMLGYRILVRAPVLKRRSSLIIMEDAMQEASRKCVLGKVLAVGPTAFTGAAQGYWCEPGDWVIYSKIEREPLFFPIVDSEGVKTGEHVCYTFNDDRLVALVSKETMQALMVDGFDSE